MLKLIEELQPYNSPNPVISPLSVIHSMDVTDKHRELVLFFPTGAFEVPMDAMIDLMQRFVSYDSTNPDTIPVDMAAEFERQRKVVPQISFKNFGGRKIQPVVPGLVDLFSITVRMVRKFDRLR